MPCVPLVEGEHRREMWPGAESSLRQGSLKLWPVAVVSSDRKRLTKVIESRL